jgi:SNF2 family DNA or RNA helicase
MSWFDTLAGNAPSGSPPSGDGHWRKLDATATGHDQTGNKVPGRTWVGQFKKGFAPKQHQLDAMGAAEAMGPRGGVIFAHGTGTGKTPSALLAFEQLKATGKASRALVLTPAGLRTNFQDKGVRKFTKSKSVIMSRPGAVPQDTDYAIVSYDAFRRNPQAYVDAVKPDIMIADEFHRATNPNSQTYKAIESVRGEIPKFIGLTASISQNDPSDVGPLVGLARGEPIQRREFKKRFVQRVDANTKGVFGGKLTRAEVKNPKNLSHLVGDTIHYVEDLDASEKPTKDLRTVEVPMSEQQKHLYDLSLKGIDPRVQQKIAWGISLTGQERKGLFTRLMLARQASNSLHTMVPGMTLEQSAEQTPKVRRALQDTKDHLDHTKDGQVILYTNFVNGGVDVLSAGLKKMGIPFGVFAGRGVMKDADRQAAVEDYLQGKKRVIIITGAGAEGLSLGNTTMVGMLDGSYNPERNNQAEARGIRAGGLAHRKPEDRKVIVNRYVSSVPRDFWHKITLRSAPASVDQFVYGTAARKDAANRQVRGVLARRTEFEKEDRRSLFHRMFASEPS